MVWSSASFVLIGRTSHTLVRQKLKKIVASVCRPSWDGVGQTACAEGHYGKSFGRSISTTWLSSVTSTRRGELAGLYLC
jgi:hypothetical protein